MMNKELWTINIESCIGSLKTLEYLLTLYNDDHFLRERLAITINFLMEAYETKMGRKFNRSIT